MIRAGVIGVGNMGSRHARVYASLPGRCQLVAVYDPDIRRATEITERYGAEAFASAEQLLDHVDVVTIASPTECHLSHAMAALQRGVDVLIEKPVTLTTAEARRLERFAERLPKRPVIQVGHIEHFNPAVREARNLLGKDQIIALDVQRLSPYDPRIQDTDVVQDLMIHDIHVVLSLVGAPIGLVQAAGRGLHANGKLDYAAANFVFHNGVIATLAASRVTEERVRRLTVSTMDAYVTVDYIQRTVNICRRTRLTEDAHGTKAYRQESILERVYVPSEEPLVAEIEDFLGSVRERTAPQVPLSMGIRCLEVAETVRTRIAEAMHAASETGVVVA